MNSRRCWRCRDGRTHSRRVHARGRRRRSRLRRGARPEPPLAAELPAELRRHAARRGGHPGRQGGPAGPGDPTAGAGPGGRAAALPPPHRRLHARGRPRLVTGADRAGRLTAGRSGRPSSVTPVAENDTNLLSTHYFDSAAEATEAVRAADLLGLGVALSNRLVPDTDSDDDSFVEEWVVDVL